jgi:hypothetical protein
VCGKEGFNYQNIGENAARIVNEQTRRFSLNEGDTDREDMIEESFKLALSSGLSDNDWLGLALEGARDRGWALNQDPKTTFRNSFLWVERWPKRSVIADFSREAVLRYLRVLLNE